MSYYDNLEYVSNSMLNWLDISPKYFLYQIQRNSEERETKSLENGKLLHSYIEDPSKFIVADIEKPGEKTALFIEEFQRTRNIEKAKEFSGLGYKIETLEKMLKDEKNKSYLDFLDLSKDSICLTREQNFKVENAIKSLHSNKPAAELLFADSMLSTVYEELEVYFESIVNGSYSIKRKSKLDRVVIDHEAKVIKVIDLKTTSKSPIGKFKKIASTNFISNDFIATEWFQSFIYYGYYRQAAFYVDAAKSYFHDLIAKDYKIEFYFVVVRLNYSFDTQVYRVSPETLSYGKRDVDSLLISYREYIQNEIDINQIVYEI